MHVVISTPYPEMATSISLSLSMADVPCEAEPNHQEFGSLLYRNVDSVGVFWAQGRASAARGVSELRSGDVNAPLMVLLDSADCGWQAIISALFAGADDAQPASIENEELIARLRALSRRRRIPEDDTFNIAGGIFNPSLGRISRAGVVVFLTNKQAQVLHLLAMRPGHLINAGVLLDFIYGGRDVPQRKIVDVYICKIRQKLAALGLRDVIETVWGQGYRLVPNEEIAR